MSDQDRKNETQSPIDENHIRSGARSRRLNYGRTLADGLHQDPAPPLQRSDTTPIEDNKDLSRRSFLKSTAIGAAGLFAAPRILSSGEAKASERGVKVVRTFHEGATTGAYTVNQEPVDQMVHIAIRELTGIGDTGEAWKSLFPGITSTNTVAIKINLACGDVPTHPEIVNAIIDGLRMMDLDGNQLPEENIIVWDHDTAFMCNQTGYSVNYGGPGVQYYGTDYSGVGFDYSQAYDIEHSSTTTTHYVSKIISQGCDYLINAAVMKDHDNWAGITMCLKNHYGSFSHIYDAAMHGNNYASGIPALSMILRDLLGDKIKLNLIDATYCLCDGGPGYTPPYHTPSNWTYNSLLVSTDPVAVDRIGTIKINEERSSRGLGLLNPDHLPSAAGAPYFLGTDDPSSIELVEINAATQAVPEEPLPAQHVNLQAPFPNPVGGSCTLRFACAVESDVKLAITDPSGRIVSRITEKRFPSGSFRFNWHGRDDKGRLVPSGTYFCRLETADKVMHKPLVVVR